MQRFSDPEMKMQSINDVDQNSTGEMLTHFNNSDKDCSGCLFNGGKQP